MLCVRDIYFVMINLVITTKSDFSKVDRSCSCLIDDTAKLERIVCVHEPAYALNKLVVCVGFIEACWALDQVNINLIQVTKVIY